MRRRVEMLGLSAPRVAPDDDRGVGGLPKKWADLLWPMIFLRKVQRSRRV